MDTVGRKLLEESPPIEYYDCSYDIMDTSLSSPISNILRGQIESIVSHIVSRIVTYRHLSRDIESVDIESVDIESLPIE